MNNPNPVREILRAVSVAVASAVDAAGSAGAPSGVLYAAMLAHGCTLEQFKAIMSALEGAGVVCAVGERYFLGDLGLAMVKGGAA